jgi:hypothetical protein
MKKVTITIEFLPDSPFDCREFNIVRNNSVVGAIRFYDPFKVVSDLDELKKMALRPKANCLNFAVSETQPAPQGCDRSGIGQPDE